MAEERITTAPATLQRGERLEYQPLSLWAVCGLCLGIVMTALVLGSVVLIVFSGNPLYLPGPMMAIALAGAVASFIGRREILASEGTRTGSGLARWGIWLSVLSGLGYLTFTQITKLALQIQANNFLMEKSPEDEGRRVPNTGFFPRLLASRGDSTQYYRAFLLTVDDRDGAQPDNEPDMLSRFNASSKKSRPRLDMFRDTPMIKFLRQAMRNVDDVSKIRVEPLGVESCEYLRPEGKGYYEIRRIYKIFTPEIEREYMVVVNSIEPIGPGDRRRWLVNVMALPEGFKQTVTPLGIGMDHLRSSVSADLARWMNKEHLATIDNPKNYAEVAKDEKLRQRLREQGLATLMPKPPGNVEMCPWREVDRRIEISYPVSGNLEGNEADPQRYMVEGFVIVQSESPVDPVQAGPTTDPTWVKKALVLTRVDPLKGPEMPPDGPP